jgi:hypothetical protein
VTSLCDRSLFRDVPVSPTGNEVECRSSTSHACLVYLFVSCVELIERL